jgi:hypothetical protein
MKLKKGQKTVEFIYNRNENSALVTYWYNGSYKDPSYIKNVTLEEANKRYEQLIIEGYRNAMAS